VPKKNNFQTDNNSHQNRGSSNYRNDQPAQNRNNYHLYDNKSNRYDNHSRNNASYQS